MVAKDAINALPCLWVFNVVMSFCNFPMSDGTRCTPRYVYDLFCDNVGKYCPLYTMC